MKETTHYCKVISPDHLSAKLELARMGTKLLLSDQYIKTKVSLTLLAGLLLSVLLLASWSAHAENSGTADDLVVEYAIPWPSSKPLNIVIESPGRVWFTMPGINAIGSLVVTPTANIQSYKIPTQNSEPYDLAYDGSSIWFTEKSGNKIGRLNVSTKNIIEYPIPTSESAPTGIDVAPDGTVWFVEQDGNKVGKVNPTNGAIDEFLYGTAGAQFEDIAVATNNSVWMTAPGLNQVVKYVPSTDEFSFVPVVDFGIPPYTPHNIAIDDAGFTWISAPEPDLIGRHVPGTLALWRWYVTPTSGGYPTGLAITESNNLRQIWFVENASGKAGRITTDIDGNVLQVGEVLLSSTSSAPTGIAVDSNGSAWITEYSGNMIAEWRPPYFNLSYLPLASR